MLKLKNGNIRLWGNGARLKIKGLKSTFPFGLLATAVQAQGCFFNLKKKQQYSGVSRKSTLGALTVLAL